MSIDSSEEWDKVYGEFLEEEYGLPLLPPEELNTPEWYNEGYSEVGGTMEEGAEGVGGHWEEEEEEEEEVEERGGNAGGGGVEGGAKSGDEAYPSEMGGHAPRPHYPPPQYDVERQFGVERGERGGNRGRRPWRRDEPSYHRGGGDYRDAREGEYTQYRGEGVRGEFGGGGGGGYRGRGDRGWGAWGYRGSRRGGWGEQ